MRAPVSTIVTIMRHGIWRVTLDGVFFGDYRSARQASESADAAALALRETGRVVQIVTEPTSPTALS